MKLEPTPRMDQLLAQIDQLERVGRDEAVLDQLWCDLLAELEATSKRQGVSFAVRVEDGWTSSPR